MPEDKYAYFTAKCEKNYKNKEIIGYAACYPNGDHLFSSKLYVRKEHRGKGIARGFLGEMIALCRLEYGLDKIRLMVSKQNKDAIAAYHKMGFETIEPVKVDIGGGFFMDDYLMELKIDKILEG